jgi:hypothetical protein
MTPDERKQKVNLLKEEHQNYFITLSNNDVLFIPKMAYRPPGKDDLYISFFKNELEKSQDIYTEFVSIEYLSEDPKRTLYYLKYNPYWKEEYELSVSNSGFERYLVPVSELKVINDVTTRNKEVQQIFAFEELPDPEENFSYRGLVTVLNRIADILENIEKRIK